MAALISDPHFIKTHLNHNYNKNRNNHDIGHRRVIMYLLPDGFMSPEDPMSSYLVGSANGLICISNLYGEIVVANPCTREVKKVTQIPKFCSSCYGFGYDKYTDDYKVVGGFRKGEDQTCFQVFSLKSNVWKVIGDVKYTFRSRRGILCNGALHWVMYQKGKAVILSFDLSQEDFKEIPQAKDTLYQSVISSQEMSLGIMEECLCIYPSLLIPNKIWMMKKYNVKDSWGIIGVSQECELNSDVLRFFKQLKNGVPYDRRSDSNILFFNTSKFIGAPIFVQSLISPHACHRDTRS